MHVRTALLGLVAAVTLASCGTADDATPTTSPTTATVATSTPDLMGLTLDEALDVIEETTGTRPTQMMESDGVVISQSPEPGEPIPPSGGIAIEFSE